MIFISGGPDLSLVIKPHLKNFKIRPHPLAIMNGLVNPHGHWSTVIIIYLYSAQEEVNRSVATLLHEALFRRKI